MSVSILIPYRPDSPQREAIAAWHRHHLQTTYPCVQTIRCDDGAVDGPFNRSRALNRCRALATEDLLWVLDVDTAPHPDDLGIALAALGDHAWIDPYRTALELDQVGTTFVLDGRATPHSWNRHTVRGHAHGLPLIRADVWDDIGGWDETFAGWGYEDMAMHDTLTTLHPPVIAPPIEHIRTLTHPRQASVQSARAHDHYNDAYLPARGDAHAMRQIIKDRT